MKKGKSGYHARVIIGRRWKNNQSEFNIRNSWGQDCSEYLPGIECNKEEGTFWFSDEKLAKSLAAYIYIF